MKKKLTIDTLAAMTQRGFTDMEQRLGERMDKGFQDLTTAIVQLTTAMHENFQHVNARLDSIRDDISDVPAMREELHDLRRRVEHLEQKAGRAQ